MSEEKLVTFEETGGENELNSFVFDLQRFAQDLKDTNKLLLMNSDGNEFKGALSSIKSLSVGALTGLTFGLGIADGFAIGFSSVADSKIVDGKVTLVTDTNNADRVVGISGLDQGEVLSITGFDAAIKNFIKYHPDETDALKSKIGAEYTASTNGAQYAYYLGGFGGSAALDSLFGASAFNSSLAGGLSIVAGLSAAEAWQFSYQDTGNVKIVSENSRRGIANAGGFANWYDATNGYVGINEIAENWNDTTTASTFNIVLGDKTNVATAVGLSSIITELTIGGITGLSAVFSAEDGKSIGVDGKVTLLATASGSAASITGIAGLDIGEKLTFTAGNAMDEYHRLP